MSGTGSLVLPRQGLHDQTAQVLCSDGMCLPGYQRPPRWLSVFGRQHGRTHKYELFLHSANAQPGNSTYSVHSGSKCAAA